MKKNKWFVVEIEILSNDWDYRIGQIIQIPVLASSGFRAYYKTDRYFQGSEFPSYRIGRVNMCDEFLFNPTKLK